MSNHYFSRIMNRGLVTPIIKKTTLGVVDHIDAYAEQRVNFINKMNKLKIKNQKKTEQRIIKEERPKFNANYYFHSHNY